MHASIPKPFDTTPNPIRSPKVIETQNRGELEQKACHEEES